MMKTRKGFTLVEMLVVIGILAILIGAGMTSFSSATKKAQKAKTQELVSNVATALEILYQNENAWPRRLLNNDGAKEGFTPEAAYELGKRNLITLTCDAAQKKTVANDRCGIVDTWAQTVIKRVGENASEDTAVPSGGKIRDHRMFYALDRVGDGFVEANVGGETIKIGAKAVVWGYGVKGKECRYSEGLRGDAVFSWSRDQVVK